SRSSSTRSPASATRCAGSTETPTKPGSRPRRRLSGLRRSGSRRAHEAQPHSSVERGEEQSLADRIASREHADLAGELRTDVEDRVGRDQPVRALHVVDTAKPDATARGPDALERAPRERAACNPADGGAHVVPDDLLDVDLEVGE